MTASLRHVGISVQIFVYVCYRSWCINKNTLGIFVEVILLPFLRNSVFDCSQGSHPDFKSFKYKGCVIGSLRGVGLTVPFQRSHSNLQLRWLLPVTLCHLLERLHPSLASYLASISTFLPIHKVHALSSSIGIEHVLASPDRLADTAVRTVIKDVRQAISRQLTSFLMADWEAFKAS